MQKNFDREKFCEKRYLGNRKVARISLCVKPKSGLKMGADGHNNVLYLQLNDAKLCNCKTELLNLKYKIIQDHQPV